MQRFLALRGFLTLMLLLAASTISLTGCGNKGPLYLPPPPVQEISSPAEASEETEESEDSPENTKAAEEPETTEAD